MSNYLWGLSWYQHRNTYPWTTKAKAAGSQAAGPWFRATEDWQRQALLPEVLEVLLVSQGCSACTDAPRAQGHRAHSLEFSINGHSRASGTASSSSRRPGDPWGPAHN